MPHDHSKSGVFEKPKRSVAYVVCRLFKQYALRYWFRLALGIFAALLMGGSLLVALRILDSGLSIGDTILSNRLKKNKDAEAVQLLETTSMDEAQPQEKIIAPATKTDDASRLSLDNAAKTDNQKPQLDDKSTKQMDKWLTTINTYWVGWFHQEKLTSDSTLNAKMLVFILLLVFVGFFFTYLGNFANKYYLRWVGMRVLTDIRIDTFKCIDNQSLSFFAQNNVGTLISRCTNDISAVEQIFSNSVADLITAPVYLVVALYMIIEKLFTLGVPIVYWFYSLSVIALLVPIYVLSQILKNFERRTLKRVGHLVSAMQENFSGIQVVKAFHREDYEVKKFRYISEKYFRTVEKAILADTFVQPITHFGCLLIGSVFLYVCYRCNIRFSALATVAIAMNMAYKPLKNLINLNATLQKCAAAAERVLELLDSNTCLPVPANPERISHLTDQITFKDVDFKYTPDGEEILNGISFSIKKGNHVALVGQTGSGKSTIANLLARFYDPTNGNITIDGKDLRNLDVDDFRRMVGIVSQDTFLFNNSIEENISYGNLEATHEQILEAANQANATEFINEFQDGFQHIVGERGNLLSGGQKQRLAIARAIIKNPPILILDEATSALDSVTEHLVQDAINNVMRDRTVLSIAHRLSTIKSADLILVIEKGRIVEAGNHRELYEKNGEYRKLCDIQFSENKA